jgi:hypothetical protein
MIGYLKRSIHQLFEQDAHVPWVSEADFYKEREFLPQLNLENLQLSHHSGGWWASATPSLDRSAC